MYCKLSGSAWSGKKAIDIFTAWWYTGNNPQRGRPGSRGLPPGRLGKRRAVLWSAGPGALLLLVQSVKFSFQPVDFRPELFILNLEPRGPFCLLDKQFCRVWRVHVHLPFLDARRSFPRRRFAGRGRCGLGLSRILAADFLGVKAPETVPHAPL